MNNPVTLFWKWLNEEKEPTVCELAGLRWSQEEFNHNFFLSGSIGSGKTNAIKIILSQLFSRVKKWGGIWVDAKGDSHHHLLRAAENAKRLDDVLILEVPFNGRLKYKPNRLNLLKAGGLSPQTVSKIVSDLSSRGENKSRNSDFFKVQTEQHVADGIQFLEYIGSPVTMRRLNRFLCDPQYMVNMLKSLEPVVAPISSGMLHSLQRSGTNPDFKNGEIKSIDLEKLSESLESSEPSNPVARHWINSFLRQPPDQRGGVVSSIANALCPFLSDELIDVFSSDEPDTISFQDINEGKIICVVCPSSLPREKAALTQYFKSLFFYTASSRYDLRMHNGDSGDNQLVLFADEYQRAAANTDIMFLDILRDAKAAFVASCQDGMSLVPVVGKDVTNVILGKFRNKIIFSAESPESAEHSSALFGKRTIWKTSHGSSGGKSSQNRSQVDEAIIKPEHFMNMKNHYCAILHTSKKIRKSVKFPLYKGNV